MNEGYVKVWRKINDNQFLQHDNNAYLVFTKLLTFVDWRTGKYDAGRFKLAELCNLNPNTLYSVLTRLETQHLINIKSNNKYSTFSICNWGKYQNDDNTTLNNAATTRQQPDNNQTTLNKNKEERIKKNTTNVVLAKTPSADINEMFLYWENKIGYGIQSNVRNNRYACSNLLKKFGKDKLMQLIDGVAMAHGERYAPSIADFASLQYKLNELLKWGNSQRQTKTAKGRGFKVS